MCIGNASVIMLTRNLIHSLKTEKNDSSIQNVNNSKVSYILCCRLKDIEKGYWTFVTYFTRMDAVKTINKLTQITTDLGKGHIDII